MESLGKEEARLLLEMGWRQGSIFVPNEWVQVSSQEPPPDFLIVLTQSCGVVSPNWKANPYIEIAYARRQEKFKPKSVEAKGRNFRHLMIPIAGEGFAALMIDVNTRRFIHRELLLKFRPDHPPANALTSRTIGGWMGRIYSRTALPNELVDRFGNGWRDAFDSLLKTPLNDNETVSDHIPNMFIAWAPDEETEGPYTVDFVLVATDGSKAEQIDRILEGLRPADTDLLNAKFRVEAADALMLADVEGLTNFSDWDYLSPLAEEGARTL